jgi:two-component system, response regulator RegA
MSSNPRLFVVDDDRAVLSLVGTTVTCIDVLRALRDLSPQCEAVLMTGYKDLATAVDAVKQSLPEGAVGAHLATAVTHPAPLVEVARDHIVRTLEMVEGNKAVAARMLGMSRRALYRQLERHGLHRRVPARRAAGASLQPAQ